MAISIACRPKPSGNNAARLGTKELAYAYGDQGKGDQDLEWAVKNAPSDEAQNVHAVAQKEPNPQGLYDMDGNALQWVQDLFGDYPTQTVQDPKGPAYSSPCQSGYRGGLSGSCPVIRGGSEPGAIVLRHEYLDAGSGAIGFRLARSIP